MTVRVYRSTDPSAPAASASAGGIISILDACLVNGYGAKTAAGWTKEFSATNQAIYKPGSGGSGREVLVDDTGSSDYATVAGLFGATSISAYASYATGTKFGRSDGPWVVVADATFFYLLTSRVAAYRKDEYDIACAGDLYALASGGHRASVAVGNSGSYSAEKLFSSAPIVLSPYGHTGGTTPNLPTSVGNMLPVTPSQGVVSGYGSQDNGAGKIPLLPVWVAAGPGYAPLGVYGVFPGLWLPVTAGVSLWEPSGTQHTIGGKTLERFNHVYSTVAAPISMGFYMEVSDTWGS